MAMPFSHKQAAQARELSSIPITSGASACGQSAADC
jgi:hypothetical protein